MWPLERHSDVVRIGRDRIECWAWTARGLVLGSQQPLAAGGLPDAAGLAAALRTSFERGRDQRGGPGQRPRDIDVVLESFWLPVMLLELGRTLWSCRQIEALLRHRLAQLFVKRELPVDSWELRLDHVAGEGQSLGFGMAPLVKQSVLEAAAGETWRIRSLQPAFVWGWQRLERDRRALGGANRRCSGWWVWLEQDRSLVCRVERGRVRAMNAGATVPLDDAQCWRLIEIEALRQGASDSAACGVAAGWNRGSSALSRRRDGGRLTWACVAASATEPMPRARPAPSTAPAA